jgi:hypothetical protein
MSHPWNTDGWLYGTPPMKAYNKKIYRRVGIYTTKVDAEKDERRYKRNEYLTRIARLYQERHGSAKL